MFVFHSSDKSDTRIYCYLLWIVRTAVGGVHDYIYITYTRPICVHACVKGLRVARVAIQVAISKLVAHGQYFLGNRTPWIFKNNVIPG